VHSGESLGYDYTTGEDPSLAWDAMLRLVERRYPDYKD
jgi:hypothetical protein